MTITPVESALPMTCFRCTSLGLPPLGIQAGETYLLIAEGEKRDTACIDCFTRLTEEIQQAEQDE